MPLSKVQAVCGSCRWQANCKDASTLERLRRFLENSGLAAELMLASGKRYRLGCERYTRTSQQRAPWRPRQQLVVSNDASRPVVDD